MIKQTTFVPSSFSADIDAEVLKSLPRAEFCGKIIIVDTASAVRAIVEELLTHPVVGIDTETKPTFVPGKKTRVALLQISTSDTCYLFRLNKIGLPKELRAFLERADILKIGLSLRDDLTGLRRIEQFDPQGFVELQQLAPAYGILSGSLQKIYAIVFGKYMSKAQRMTNWEAKELTDKQQVYAALDAQACLEIYLRLLAEPNPHPAQFGLIHL